MIDVELKCLFLIRGTIYTMSPPFELERTAIAPLFTAGFHLELDILLTFLCTVWCARWIEFIF